MKKTILSIILALVATVTINAQKSYDYAISQIIDTDTMFVDMIATIKEVKYARGCKSFEIILSDEEGKQTKRFVAAGPNMKMVEVSGGSFVILDQNFFYYSLYRRKNGSYAFINDGRDNNDYELQTQK